MNPSGNRWGCRSGRGARIRAAYSAALEGGYRFSSLGDAMLLERAEQA